MTKQEKTALNMARFIRSQTLTLLEKLNELDADEQADICESLHDHADELYRSCLARFGELVASPLPRECATTAPHGHTFFCFALPRSPF